MRFNRSDPALNADLYWAVCSADLMQLPANAIHTGLQSIHDAPHLNDLSQWIKSKDHSQPLRELITKRKPNRLGIYYETLWQYVLENYPGFELISRNLPVREQGKTLGELDFVYFCQHRQRYIHLETAVKYYLGLQTPQLPAATEQPVLSWSQWLGPGCKDRLDLKLLKMLHHQTQLTDNQLCHDTLKSLGIETPLKEICLKGYFFYPLGCTSEAPRFSHPQHAHGHWLPISQLNRLDTQAAESNHWQIMNKEQWLAPLNHNQPEQLLSLTALAGRLTEQLSNRAFPIMVANMAKTDSGYQETKRFFVTPDIWPFG